MPRRPSSVGIALAMYVAGTVLIMAGLRNATVADTLRSLLRGQPIPSGPSDLPRRITGAAETTGRAIAEATANFAGGTITGAAVADTARSYIGVPYRWAGEDPSGWDCSGFVTWVLTKHGVKLPSNHHTVSAQFYVWPGAITLPRAAAQPGDLVCWVSHVGIATGPDTMVNAPGIGKYTREDRIWRVPAPVIRRPKQYLTDEGR